MDMFISHVNDEKTDWYKSRVSSKSASEKEMSAEEQHRHASKEQPLKFCEN